MFVVALLFAFVAMVGSASAANVVIIVNDGAGEGFNDPTAVAPVGGNWGTTLGQQRLIAFTYAANIWGACLQSVVTIEVLAQMDPQFCNAGSAVLGSAGTTFVHRDFAGAPLASTWYNQALANALAGVDLNPGTPEINATFNSNLNGNPACLGGIGWYYGLDGNPGVNIDFVSVVLHEIGHGIGFQTFVSQTGAKLVGFNDQYMIFLENHGAVPADYPSMSDAQRAAANIADPNLHWIGPIVTAAGNALLTGGISNGHVRMHGPNPYQSGSSVSHWSTALTPNELMEPSYTGANHDPSLAWELMEEIGWTFETKVTEGCAGSTVDLASPDGTLTSGTDDFQDRGIYVTALKDFNLCAIGIEGDFIPGETLTANVYDASGVTRGALLATGSATVEFAGQRTHYIPVAYNLEECHEYDIAVEWDHSTIWPWWDENTNTEPYDVAGVIRVRDGEFQGGAGNFALPHITLQGTSRSPEVTSILESAPFGTCADGTTNRGAFISAAKTISACAVGFEADYPGGSPVTLTANIYEAVGLVRGTLLATGTLETSVGGLQFHDIPVNAVLLEGSDYEIEVLYPATTWGCFSEGGAPLPYTVDGAIIVVDGTQSGNPANTFIPHLSVSWSEGPGAGPFDITGPFLGIPDGTSIVANIAFGKYVTALSNHELTSLGWYADLGPGETLIARVYEAAGTVRGALVSQGSITTGPAGYMWHDIPVAASLVAGQDYDLEIDWTGVSTVNGFPFWVNVAIQPYNAYGILQVVVGESGGVPDAAQECAQMRVNACATTVTGVDPGPTAVPAFALYEAYPNPFSGSATLGYELEEASTVTVAVYDVAGRKVADVMNARSLPAGPGQLSLTSADLPSGVYFVKLSTPARSVTRKITIVR
jgi:hypothetical protein